jgi:hypothetical protein
MNEDMERLSRIVEELYLKTVAGLLEWKDGGDDDYFVSTNTGSVTISAILNKGAFFGGEEYVVNVRNKGGASVARIRSDIQPPPSGYPDTQWRGMVGELYQLARRKALRVEDVLDSLLGDIEAIGKADPDLEDGPS